ncbi:hypothetical protein, partial [Paraburkholderia graminis]|uniref:hypothetical protein n=1 Tax=Paraburkholderia graminis TaxID=60548 RepID=UPI0038BA7F80
MFAGAMRFTVLYLRSFMRTEGHGALRDCAAPARHGLDGYESDGGGRASHVLVHGSFGGMADTLCDRLRHTR